VLGDPQPGGLLQALRGEVHPLGEVPELVPGAGPQPDLRQGRGGMLGGGVSSQHGRDPEWITGLLAVHLVRAGQQGLAGRGEQPPERLEVHGPKSGTRLDRVLIAQ